MVMGIQMNIPMRLQISAWKVGFLVYGPSLPLYTMTAMMTPNTPRNIPNRNGTKVDGSLGAWALLFADHGPAVVEPIGLPHPGQNDSPSFNSLPQF